MTCVICNLWKRNFTLVPLVFFTVFSPMKVLQHFIMKTNTYKRRFKKKMKLCFSLMFSTKTPPYKGNQHLQVKMLQMGSHLCMNSLHFQLQNSTNSRSIISSTSLGVPQQGQFFHKDIIEDFSQFSLTSNDIKNLLQKDVTSHIITHEKFHLRQSVPTSFSS